MLSFVGNCCLLLQVVWFLSSRVAAQVDDELKQLVDDELKRHVDDEPKRHVDDVLKREVDDKLKQQIDEFVDAIMEQEAMIGMSLAVTKDGRPFMAKGYGVTYRDEGQPVTSETLFVTASCTKAFTSSLLAKLIEDDGRYTLDSPVKDIFPGFYVADSYRSNHSAIRDILAHTVGYVDTMLHWYLGEVTTRDDLISRVRFFDTAHAFRSCFNYSNTLYSVAGHLIEILKGSSWEQATRDEILDPLGMTNTTFVYDATAEQKAKMATPYEYDVAIDALRPVSLELFGENQRPGGPAAGLLTNSRDMQKWLVVLSKQGLMEDGTRLLSEQVLHDTMMATQNPFAAPRPSNDSWPGPLVYVEKGHALGWVNGQYRGYRMVTHGGYMMGYMARVTLLPDRGIGLYLNTNSRDGSAEGNVMFRVMSFIFDLFLGVNCTTTSGPSSEGHAGYVRSEPDGVARFSPQATRYSPLPKLTSAQLRKYEGTYRHFGLGNMSIFYNETAAELQAKYGFVGGGMEQSGNDTFLIHLWDPVSFFPPMPTFFESSSGDPDVIDRLECPLLYPLGEAVFERDLDIADKPPPNDGC